jgi:DNA-binding MurR/RpiR family transcriptional regulator
MSKSQQKLADFVLQNLPEVAMMSSADLAGSLDVSEATVVRFAQILGFEGYPDLRQQLQTEFLRQYRSSDRVAVMINEKPGTPGPLSTIVTETVRHLQQLLQNVTDTQVEEAARRIVKSRRVFVFGEGAPASLTVLADFWLSRLGCQVVRVNQTGRRFFDYIFQAGQGDLGVVFAFRRPSPEALALLEHLANEGGESILITDLVSSRMHPLASQVFLVQRGPMEAFRPLGAPLAVVDALILSVMRLRGDDAVEHLRRLDNLRQRHGYL